MNYLYLFLFISSISLCGIKEDIIRMKHEAEQLGQLLDKQLIYQVYHYSALELRKTAQDLQKAHAELVTAYNEAEKSFHARWMRFLSRFKKTDVMQFIPDTKKRKIELLQELIKLTEENLIKIDALLYHSD